MVPNVNVQNVPSTVLVSSQTAADDEKKRGTKRKLLSDEDVVNKAKGTGKVQRLSNAKDFKKDLNTVLANDQKAHLEKKELEGDAQVVKPPKKKKAPFVDYSSDIASLREKIAQQDARIDALEKQSSSSAASKSAVKSETGNVGLNTVDDFKKDVAQLVKDAGNLTTYAKSAISLKNKMLYMSIGAMLVQKGILINDETVKKAAQHVDSAVDSARHAKLDIDDEELVESLTTFSDLFQQMWKIEKSAMGMAEKKMARLCVLYENVAKSNPGEIPNIPEFIEKMKRSNQEAKDKS
ncbi:hypothetical protein AKO1_002666 [Acrasis kona]|uniref:Uncharacterized protein n=1 Tax=Acrasis kona TaxID=1008807 RepID=A0AAW2ZP70_9EUKA